MLVMELLRERLERLHSQNRMLTAKQWNPPEPPIESHPTYQFVHF